MSTGLFKVYRSSAGSGKTFTLVREYLKLALRSEDPSSYRKILAITFTNKAAAEMKERVLGNLQGFSIGESSSDFDETMFSMLKNELEIESDALQKRASDVFENMLHHYSDVSISTIDKFVHGLIRAFARDLNLNPEFEVEMDTKALLERSVDELLSQVGIDEELSDLLVSFAQSKMENESSFEVKSEMVKFAEHLHKEESHYHLKKIKDLTEADFQELRSRIIKLQAQTESLVKAVGSKGMQAIESSGIPITDFSYGDLPNHFRIWSGGEFKSIGKRLAGMIEKGSFIKGTSSHGSKESEEANLQNFIDVIDEYEKLEQDKLSIYILAGLIIKGIYPMATLQRIEEQMNLIKEREGLLPIGDFNRMVGGIIAENPAPFIYERIGERFDHYLIDEFQDTSVLQWQNFLPLVENSLSKALFNMLVGDGKQAIYRWRGGEVEQFDQLPAIYRHMGKSNILDKEQILRYNFEPARLEHNFRSRKEVVNFNNELFDLLSDTLLHEDYKGIYEEQSQVPHRANGGLVCIDELTGEEDDKDMANLELMLERVREAKEDGYSYADMSVICRKNDHAKICAQALLNEGIPVISSESLMLNQDPAVKLLLHTLILLSRPDDAVAAVAVFRSWHQLNDSFETLHEDLIEFRFWSKKSKKTMIKCEGFFEKYGLSEVFESAEDEGLYEKVERLIRVFGLDAKANIFVEFFLEQVHQFAVKKKNDVSAFVDFWAEHGNKISVKMARGLDAVSIMSIHKSKGLEFPVVILPFLSWRDRGGKEIWLSLNDEFPPLASALVSSNKSLESTDYAEDYDRENQKSLLDDLNLLYVACTRARDRLYMFIAQKAKPSSWIQSFIQASGKEGEAPFLWGERIAQKKKKEDGTGDEVLKAFPSKALASQLRMSLEAPMNWESSQPIDARERGVLVHRILEAMDEGGDLRKAVNAVLKRPGLAEEWHRKLEKAMTVPQVKEWFKKESESLVEISLMDEKGHLHRPDRMVKNGDSLDIIDFKTGEKRKSYAKQLQAYVRLAEAIYNVPARAYILYLDSAEVEEIGMQRDLFG